MKFEDIETFLTWSDKTKIKPFLRKTFYFYSPDKFSDLYIFSDTARTSFPDYTFWICPSCGKIYTSDVLGNGCVKCGTDFYINADYKKENRIYAWFRIRLTYFFQVLGAYFKS